MMIYFNLFVLMGEFQKILIIKFKVNKTTDQCKEFCKSC
jgi:hypothetical protein